MTRRLSDAMSKLEEDASIANIQDFFPQILRGGDPLGEFFSKSVSPGDRRANGATFTPSWLIDLQLDQIAAKGVPSRVVDAGAGTGRYALRAARLWPRATVIAVERDPILAEAIRINARAMGVKIEVLCADYLSLGLPPIDGITAFIGNPPYVRHHDISPRDKAWYSREMAQLRLPHSQLAGLHVYFYLKSYLLSKPGDVGCFVSAAEWMETNYGESMRSLFCLIGGESLIRAHPGERIFRDALTTSVIVTWSIGAKDNVTVSDLAMRVVKPHFSVAREELLGRSKWPGYGRAFSAQLEGQSVLGDFFRISRGQVTGHNEIWIASKQTERLIPERYLFPCVTDAMEIISANGVLRDKSRFRRVIDLPVNLSELSTAERKNVDSFLEVATMAGAAESYIAKHRKPWWRVGLKSPSPIVMSYMGRRPPSFARNACNARIINIAHSLTPLRVMNIAVQERLVAWLNENVRVTDGRTYGGGMVKFEPGDAMDIPLPVGMTFEG
jgi:hypothetical protein